MALPFTEPLIQAIDNAFQEASRKKHSELTENHLLKALLEDPKSYFFSLCSSCDLSPMQLLQAVEDSLSHLPTLSGPTQQPQTSQGLQKKISEAQSFAQKWGDSYIGSDHFFLAFWENPTEPFTLWKKKSKNSSTNIETKIRSLRGEKTLDSPASESSLQALEKYCRNLTTLAKQGKLDPVIGREEEIRRTIQVLSRRTKNNPMLIGEPGVGKTAIAEGLAYRITQGDVPDSLKNRQLFALDMGSLIAGTKFRGEFEERMKGILQEMEKSDGRFLLFIDEVHTLIGAGATEGSMDAANLLKPALARGSLHCIGATTLNEYQKHIEKDAALERRFQPILISEPSPEEAIAILRGLKERFEIFHGVRITEPALHAAVFLSLRYLPDRRLPDKAIDLIDEGASLIRMQLGSLPLPIDTKERELSTLFIKQEMLKKEEGSESKIALKAIEKQIAHVKEELSSLHQRWDREKTLIEGLKERKNTLEKLRLQEEEAERVFDYNRVAELRYSIIPAKKKELEEAQNALATLPNRLLQEEVDEHLIAQIVSKWTGIPLDKMLEGEAKKLLHLEEDIGKRVIGQESAIQAISEAIRRSRAGLSDPGRPIGVFLFLGPTGVGKTELAKALAEQLFDREDALLRLDMSEYMEKHSIAKLIGSPPGYIGYEEGGQLTEALRHHPYSVVLFDEVEKAHPEVLNLLLQIFDEGRVTDSKGRKVNCKNSLFIMTSNVGSSQILSLMEEDREISKALILHTVDTEIKSHFRPEFLNRLDDIIPFLPLKQKDMEKIVALQLQQVRKRMNDRLIELEWDNKILSLLAQEGFSPTFGARPLKRLIQQKVVNLLATALLEGKIPEHSVILLRIITEGEGGKISFTIKKR